jgi:outer membrane protein OmpA-like peptidoglycan-associated protein
MTEKGILGFGAVALTALAAFAIWQYVPKETNTAPTPPPQISTPAATTGNAAIPPSVTGPVAAASSSMPKTVAAQSTVPAAPTQAIATVPAKAEAPKVETAKVETPKVETPKVEVPIVELPKVEIPKVEIPKVEIPKVEIPKVETPKVDAPKVDVPKSAPVAAAKVGCETNRAESVLRSICFRFNSDRLSKASRSKLDAIAPVLKKSEGKFELSGFADAVGNKLYNADLSERRGKAVLKYLKAKGVDVSKISVKSYGSEAAEKTGTGNNQRERRVDVKAL